MELLPPAPYVTLINSPYLKIYPDTEIRYPSFVIDEEDVEMQIGEIGDTGVVYDPDMNESNMQAIPDDME